ncbi:MAG: hypothetical protein IPM29_05860 [Planctomycetes bacterium]|nr:hypothetical protein [Planctomycetota bacterium]
MSTRIAWAALLGALLCGAALGFGRAPAPDPQDPAAATQAPTGSLLLTVEIDSAGVRVLEATRKPALAFRAPRHADDMPFRWTLRDAEAESLATGGFDPFRICLDPAHAGQAPHFEGDVIVPHVAHFNVKIPALAGAATIEFGHRDDGGVRPFGSARFAEMAIR